MKETNERHKDALHDFVDYYGCIAELQNDIADRFPYPALWAAIDRLLEYKERFDRAYADMRKGGYTSDDAFELYRKEKGGGA